MEIQPRLLGTHFHLLSLSKCLKPKLGNLIFSPILQRFRLLLGLALRSSLLLPFLLEVVMKRLLEALNLRSFQNREVSVRTVLQSTHPDPLRRGRGLFALAFLNHLHHPIDHDQRT